MSILLVTIEDGKEEALKRILHEIPFVKDVREADNSLLSEENAQYKQMKQILDNCIG